MAKPEYAIREVSLIYENGENEPASSRLYPDWRAKCQI